MKLMYDFQKSNLAKTTSVAMLAWSTYDPTNSYKAPPIYLSNLFHASFIIPNLGELKLYVLGFKEHMFRWWKM